MPLPQGHYDARFRRNRQDCTGITKSSRNADARRLTAAPLDILMDNAVVG
jgi:hypothetical protein